MNDEDVKHNGIKSIQTSASKSKIMTLMSMPKESEDVYDKEHYLMVTS